tara:strand:+ start:80 stop:541 length:462 start_codon:yes stop_codon:yes gene_type:complete
MAEIFSLNAQELQRYQPNRYPFLMIDRVTAVKPGIYAEGYKNLTNNEWFFPKHFEGHPNMPGALQLEAMAQMLTVAITTIDGLEGKVTHALEHKVKFMREVLPGDRLNIRAELISWKRGIGKGKAICSVDETPVSQADMMITIPDILKSYLPE